MTTVRYRFGDYALDLATHELLHRDAPVPLPARVFECLGFLIAHRERAVTRDELVRAVFGRADVSDAQLAQIVVRTRRAIGDDGQAQHSIRTVPRFGFRWLPPVVEEALGEEPGASVAAGGAAGQPVAPLPAQPQQPVPAPDRRRGFWLPAAVVGGAVAALVAVAAWWLPGRVAPTAAVAPAAAGLAEVGEGAVVVLPTTVDEVGDAAWARLGLMDFIGDRLRRGGLPVLSSESVLGVLHGQPDHAPRQLHAALHARWIVEGRATRDGAVWHVALTASGRDGVIQRGQGADADLLAATRAASDALAAVLGAQVPAGGDEPALAERLQRARAAMLANEIETARAILIAAPELQRRQPRLRYQLARVDFRAGEYARGLDTLDALLASEAPEVAGDPLFRAQVLNARGAMLVRLDRSDEAERTYDEAIALVGDRPHPAERGQALSGRAVVHAMQERFDRALHDFGLARVQLQQAGDVLAVARVDANLGILEVERDRPAQALPYLAQATQAFAEMGAVNELANARTMRVVAELQLLHNATALEESARGSELAARVRDPAQRADLLLVRADALVASGELAEARRLLAMPEAAMVRPSGWGKRESLQVELALRDGDAAGAVALADAALRDWPDDVNPRLRAWTRLRREQAALLADLPVSADAADTLGDSVPEKLTLATAHRAAGRDAAADDAYRAALSRAERQGVPAEVAAAVAAHAGWLLDRGRSEEAAALVGRAVPLAGEDFDLAVLEARLLGARGQERQRREVVARAIALAGERALPPGLAPASQGP